MVPFVIAGPLLAAHFLRQGNLPLAGICVLAPFLLFIRKRWASRALQVFAYGGAAIWLYTAISLVRDRLATGAPWIRMSLILLGVTVFTFWAGQLISSDVVKRRYP